MLPDRIAEKIDASGVCWEWTAGKDGQGYGFAWHANKQHRAHRLVYELLVGEIPEGMQLDHLCRNRACVNPDHLEVVTQTTNRRRRMWGACAHGHRLSGDNLHLDPVGKRKCRTCMNDAQEKYLVRTTP